MMLHENYKTKVEYGVSAVVILIGLFFIYQASTIGSSKEMFGPDAMPFALSISTVFGESGLPIELSAARLARCRLVMAF